MNNKVILTFAITCLFTLICDQLAWGENSQIRCPVTSTTSTALTTSTTTVPATTTTSTALTTSTTSAPTEADVVLKPEDSFYNPDEEGGVTIKEPICLENPYDIISAVQFDLCEYNSAADPIDCMKCIDCELTERTTVLICEVLELANGCCKVILFCTNPICGINPGLCDVVTLVYQTLPISPECLGDECITQIPENIIVSDYDGYQLTAVGLPSEVCPFICGDVCPPDNPMIPGWDCGDGKVDIFDIICGIDFALTLTTPDGCQAVRADVPTGTPGLISQCEQTCGGDCVAGCCEPDGAINILDIMLLIDMALSRQDCCTFYYTGVIY